MGSEGDDGGVSGALIARGDEEALESGYGSTPRRRSSVDVSRLRDDAFDDDDAEGLSTGRMSVWFAGYTLACSQIGSTLVSVSQFLAGTGTLMGVTTAVLLALVTLGSVAYIQEVWMHARRKQLSVAPSPKGSSMIPPATPDRAHRVSVAAPHSGGRLMYIDLVAHALRHRFGLSDRTEWWVTVAVRITAVMQAVSLCGTAISEVIQTGVNMYVLTGVRTPRFWAGLMGGVVMTPLVWLPSFESLSWLSLLAILAVAYTAATIVFETWSMPEAVGVMLPDPTLASSFVSFSDFVFIWGGLAMVPEIQSSMRRPKRLVWSFVLDVVYTLAVLIPTGLTGLAVFQSSASSNILRQLAPNIGTKAAAAFLSLHMIIAYAVLLAAVMEGAERVAGLRERGPAPGEARNRRAKWHTNPGLTAKRIALRTAISAVCVLLALALPFFSTLVGVVSAITQSWLSYLAPPFMWLCVQWGDTARRKKLGRPERGGLSHCGKVAGAYGIMISMTVLGLGLGTWASTYELVKSVGTFGLFDPNL